MPPAALSASLLLLLLFTDSDAIRLLKEGPMIDAEGREYKTLQVDVEENVDTTPLSDGSPVRVRCTETSMVVVVKADLFKTGRLVTAAELSLGRSDRAQCRAAAAGGAGGSDFVIEVGLQDCGTKLSTSEDAVIYSNHLYVSPAAIFGITRTAHVSVPVSCHYQRTHVVSSGAQQPPLTVSSQEPSSPFSLRLMNEEWTSEASSRVFHLGDVLHLQAAYSAPHSAQTRLFMDSCVATLSPNATSVPRYFFISNHGCLTDAKHGGWNTRFRPRTRPDSLELQLNVFLFHQETRNSVYITCHLKASADMWRSSNTNKACNYVQSRWENVDAGGADVCRCCDGACFRATPTWSHAMKQRRPRLKMSQLVPA